MAEVNDLAFNISLTQEELSRLRWVLNTRVVWQNLTKDDLAQAILYDLFDALDVEVN